MAVGAQAKTGDVIPPRGSQAKPRRILAVDYGRKRIGLAISDGLSLTAQPLVTLERTNHRNDLRRLREICRARAIDHILVGHPVHMSGEAGEMAAETARFAARLRKHLGISVELVDERLTTWEAGQIMAERNASARRKRRHLDSLAAAILLREYLAQKQAPLLPAPPEKE